MSFFGNKRTVLGLVLLASIIGGVTIYQGSAFHSYGPNPAYGQNNDPTTTLWQETSDSFTQDFQTINAAFATGLGGGIAGSTGWKLSPNSTYSALALSTVSIDLGTASAKELYIQNVWNYMSGSSVTANCANANCSFGWYLTLNSTLPLTKNYTPLLDPSVALVFQKSTTQSNRVYNQLKMQRPANPVTSVDAQFNNGSCGSPATSCLFDSPAQTSSAAIQQGATLVLNYTGSSSNSGNAGKSYMYYEKDFNASATTILPWLPIGGVTYYLGYYELSDPSTVQPVLWYRNTSNGNACFTLGCSMWIGVYTPLVPTPPNPPPPTIDTGGFFGPIIRALVGLGVYILGAVATFFGYVFVAFKLALDTVGKFVGIGAIGTQLSNAFVQFGSFVVNVFATGFTIISNGVTFLINSLTALSNVVGTYWGLLTSFLSDLGAFLGGLWNVLGAFLQYGSIAAKYGLILWWVIGMSMAYRDIKLFMFWTRLSYTFILYPFKVAMWFYDTIIERVLIRVKNLIFQWI